MAGFLAVRARAEGRWAAGRAELVRWLAAVPVGSVGTDVAATARELPSEDVSVSLTSARVPVVEPPLPSVSLVMSESVAWPSGARHRPLGLARRRRNVPVYRPLVDLSTMEEQHVILTYRLNRATIQELCAQLEPDLMSPIRQPTGIPPLVQVLSVLHFFASGSFQTTVAISSGMSQPMFSKVLSRVLSALMKYMRSYIVFPEVVCLADQYISHLNAKFPGSVHDAYVMRNSSIPYVMEQLQRQRVWLIGDSGYPNLPWLLTPVRNPRTRAEERYNEAHGHTRRVIERTFGLLKARFRCLHMTGGSLMYSPKKVCHIIVACCMLHKLALRRQVPFLEEDGPDGGVEAAVEPAESEEEEDEEDDTDNRDRVIMQYFQ
ncbi:hypothetical protein NDU88_008226 [Pleurodeles waltl]|uniref:DDE Tnp4 domain-containing protein n=1 Tax=Pleurodeles waltl TaxID=8319 RepID=A0AAV7PRI8_PLEWA|nr:hypothetical protein NDU88_008226 [Pleurodeles waltl]